MPQLDVFTIYLGIVAACLALSLVWLVVARTFPTLDAARFWFAGTLAAGAGSALSLWHGGDGSALPSVLGNGLILMGSGLGLAGVRRFNGKSTPWPIAVSIGASALAGLALCLIFHEYASLRIVLFSGAQSALIGWAVVDILDRQSGRPKAGSLMAAAACTVLLLLNSARTVLAVFAVDSDMALAAWSPLQTSLVFFIAVFGALVCQFGFLLMTMDRLQSQMAQLAGVDDLTGVANRRRFLAACLQECVRSIRSGRVFAVMVIDIDRFKSINDGHGHAAGDAFLQLFAATARGQLRSQDLVARLGGDEFAVLMPETTAEQAAVIAARLVAAVRDSTFSHNGAIVGSTTSIGVAQWSKAIGGNPVALLELADQALYLTKNAGRNGVSIAPAAPSLADESLAA